jgi:hypothetical protein
MYTEAHVKTGLPPEKAQGLYNEVFLWRKIRRGSFAVYGPFQDKLAGSRRTAGLKRQGISETQSGKKAFYIMKTIRAAGTHPQMKIDLAGRFY